MSDRREDILFNVFERHKQMHPEVNWDTWDNIKSDGTAAITFDAMDEYMKECCLELLAFLNNNKIRIDFDRDDQPIYCFNGRWITKEQLFENFL